MSLTYRCIYLNNTDEDARVTYHDNPYKYWSGDDPGFVVNGDKAIVMLTGDEVLLSGSFIIQYAGQHFKITLTYVQSQFPTINHERVSDGPIPNNFEFQIVNQLSVSGTQADVVFEIIDPARR